MGQYDGEGEIQGSTALYYVRDHLGTVKDVVNSQGRVLGQLAYGPYGEVEKAEGRLPDKRYAGMLMDVPNGNYITHYRFYDPAAGRWLNRDPIGESGGLNIYAYVGGNPVSYIDPYGLRDVDVYIWRAEGLSVGHVMVTEANSTQVILSQFPSNGRRPSGPNQKKSFKDTMDAEGRASSEVWRINVPNDAAFDSAAARERGLSRWSWSPSSDETQCSIAASRALRAGGVGLNTLTTGTLMPGFFANAIQATPGIGVRLR